MNLKIPEVFCIDWRNLPEENQEAFCTRWLEFLFEKQYSPTGYNWITKEKFLVAATQALQNLK